MPRGRPLALLEISIQERETMERLGVRRKTVQALAQRARLVLGCAEGKSNKTVSAQVGLSRQTVGKWRRRFLQGHFDGVRDEPRLGAPRKDHRHRRGQSRHSDSGGDTWRRYALEHSFNGQTHRHELECHKLYLASLRPSTSSNRYLQTVHRTSFHRKVRDIVGAVPQPTGQGSHTVCRRKSGI